MSRKLPWAVPVLGVAVISMTTAAGQPIEPSPQLASAEAAPAAPTTTGTTASSDSSVREDTSEWTPLIDQNFDVPASVGEFAELYPGWASYDGWHDTEGPGLYDSSRVVSVAGGILNEHLHTEAGEALVVSITPVPHVQTYGRYEIRFRSDPIPGYHIAWLLWPADDDWSKGEIDFPEAGLGPGDVIQGFSHRTNTDDGNYGWSVTTEESTADWHTAVIEWRPDSITFVLDGVSYQTTDAGSIPSVPMFWSMQTEADDPHSSTSGNIQIDHVRSWAYAGPGAVR